MQRGPYNNRDEQYAQARLLRASGMGYRSIASEVGVQWGVIRGWVDDMPVDREASHALAMNARRRPVESLKNKEQLRRRVLELRGVRCEECGITEWRGNPVPLELHRLVPSLGYVDNNVVLLCLNCHGVTPTWRRGEAHEKELPVCQ